MPSYVVRAASTESTRASNACTAADSPAPSASQGDDPASAHWIKVYMFVRKTFLTNLYLVHWNAAKHRYAVLLGERLNGS